MKKPAILIDIDDTIAAFIGDGRLKLVPLTPMHQNYEEMHLPGFFRHLEPIEGAVESVKSLLALNLFEIYICSVPLHSSPHSYSEKVEWIHQHLPELSNRIIFTQDKSLINADYLVDDSLSWKAKWENGTRTFVHFNPRGSHKAQWQKIVEYFVLTYGEPKP